MYRTLLNPVSDLQQMIDFMDRAFSSRVSETGSVRTNDPVYSLPVDIWQKDNTFFIRAAVPGIAPQELDIQVHDGVLTIAGETKHESSLDEEVNVWRREYLFGKFQRSIRLPEFVVAENIEARFHNGFVTITVPVAIQNPKSLRVPIKTNSQPVLEQNITTTPKNGEKVGTSKGN